jgi:hypothetical protein
VAVAAALAGLAAAAAAAAVAADFALGQHSFGAIAGCRHRILQRCMPLDIRCTRIEMSLHSMFQILDQ